MENKVVVIKKKNIFTRIKEKWNELDEESRDWLKIVGIWTVDGALFGTLITSICKDAKYKRDVQTAIDAGYVKGALDAYRDMAKSNPFAMMDAKNTQVKKF